MEAAAATAAATETEFVVAFDFDKCLMRHHWWGTHRNNPIETIDPTPSGLPAAALPS